jgi:hypothetical protein
MLMAQARLLFIFLGPSQVFPSNAIKMSDTVLMMPIMTQNFASRAHQRLPVYFDADRQTATKMKTAYIRTQSILKLIKTTTSVDVGGGYASMMISGTFTKKTPRNP